jgi:hypothetical protein
MSGARHRSTKEDEMYRRSLRAVLGTRSNPARCQKTFTDTLTRIEAKARGAGLECRFLDDGNGTVTDFQTALMWARLSGLSGIPSSYVLDPDNSYDWREAHSAAASLNGTSARRAPVATSPVGATIRLERGGAPGAPEYLAGHGRRLRRGEQHERRRQLRWLPGPTRR